MINPKVSLVIPLYNEEKSLPILVERLNKLIQGSDITFEVVLVDDGSSDATGDMCRQIALADEKYHCVFMARNYGHQIALSAGISVATGTEALMILDGDLQDPPELFFEFYNYLKKGYDVVYGIRQKRKEHFFKTASYFIFYRLLKKISYINIPLDSGDFSLISRRVADILNKMPEESRYIRGMRSWIGFKQIGVTYERDERVAGESKYSLSMLFKLAYNGIFNFSEIPIKFITKLGVFSVLISLIYFISVVIKKIIHVDVPVGFTGLLFVMILFGGVQLISLGIIGEYIVRIFFQVKNRPLFIIKNRIKEKNSIDN
ncbi:MAG: glycosyltransferase family 2 protein [Bacteroidota bacterium]